MKSTKNYLYMLMFAMAITSYALAGNPQSANVIKFGNDNTLFVGDSKSATLFAYTIEASDNASRQLSYNLKDIDTKISKHLKTAVSNIIFRSMATHPVSKEIFIALDVKNSNGYTPVIVIVNQKGELRTLNLQTTKHTEFKINDAPSADHKYWDETPMRTFTFTDIDFHKGKLYVSGMSNAEFSSVLRVIDFPFDKAKISTTSIEIFHDVHNQNETRAPIQTLEIITINNEDYIIAAYTCTPLVLIPVKDLKDGAHVTGKTIAEMGYGNTPIDIIQFKSQDWNKNPYEAIVLTNKNRSAQFMNMADIAKSVSGNGLEKFEGFVEKLGTPSYTLPLTGVLKLDNQDDYHVVALERNADNGKLELVSYLKNLWFRLDNFVTEYDQPGYKYPQGFQTDVIKSTQNFIISDIGRTGFTKQ